MIRYLSAFAVAICLFIAIPSTAAQIDKRISSKLQQKLTAVSDNEAVDVVDVIVWLTEPDGWHRRRAEIMSMPGGDKRQAIATETMKAFYYPHAEPVLQKIDKLVSSGSVVFDKHLWGAFSFSLSATRDAIIEIARHPHVKLIIADEPIPARFMLPYDVCNPFDRAMWESARPMSPDALSSPMSLAWHLTRIDADDAWATGYDGTGVLVGVFDTGVDYNHTDLAGQMWHNPADPIDGSDNDGNSIIDDYYGADFFDGDGDPYDSPSYVHHGTMCAGMIVGNGSAGTSTGSAPGATLMAIRVGDGNSFVSGSDEVAAFQYALEHGIDVASMSYGSYAYNEVKDYYRYVFNNTFLTLGVPICVAAGNGDGASGHYSIPYDISTPADIPAAWYRSADSDPPGPVLAIGATTSSDAWADWASYGPTEWDYTGYYGSWHDYPSSDRLMKPDVSAPGEFVMSTDFDGGYTWTDGTSFSCPLTAGVVALMLSKNSELSLVEIDSILEVTAKDITPAGRDNQTGAGRIDADSALMFVSGKALVIDSVRIDDSGTGDGDRNIDPGESANFMFYIRNAATASAPNVQLTLTSVSNPSVSIVDNHSSYGTMSPGETRSNASDPVVLSVSISANYTEYCKCHVTITDGEGYSKPDSFSFRVGVYPLMFAYHDTLAPLLIGHYNLGYFQDMAWNWPYDSLNLLYSGAVMMGTGSGYVAEAGWDFWQMDSLHLKYTGTVIADAEGFSQYIDTTNCYWVKQYTYQWRTPPNDAFIIILYKVKNFGTSPLSGVIPGTFFDFDIPPYDSNYAVFDGVNEWAYMYHSTSGPYTGIVALDGFLRGSVIDNPTYLYEEGMGWTDAVKWGFLSGTYSLTTGSSPLDYSTILAYGPFGIDPGNSVTFAAAVVAGDNLGDFQSNANQAKTTYDTYSSTLETDEKPLPNDVALFGAYPNPFNSSVEIFYTLIEPADVSLEITDIGGRIIRREIDAAACPGMYAIRWNGTNDAGAEMPSGVYFVKLDTGKRCMVRRLFMIK